MPKSIYTIPMDNIHNIHIIDIIPNNSVQVLRKEGEQIGERMDKISFLKSIKEIELNEKGQIIRLKGYISRNSDEL